MGHFQQKHAELRERELDAKVAALQSHWGDQPENLEAVAVAYEHVKEAEEAGKFGEGAELDDSQRLSLAVEMVQELLNEEADEADETDEVAETEEAPEAEETTDEVDETEKVAEHYQLGLLLGRELADRGMEAADLDKLASEEESEAFGQLLAELAAGLIEDE